MNTTRISDIITTDDIKHWTPDKLVTISAQTGRGKSWFIKNTLYDYAKEHGQKILMLIHRTNCLTEFQKEIETEGKRDVIRLVSYQFIETYKLYHAEKHLKEYSYIICDEWHYFLSDAAFSRKTDVSLETILSAEHSIKVFMSATGEGMTECINLIYNGKPDYLSYTLESDYDYIKSLTFYHDDNDLETIANDILKHEHKGIFFINSAEKAYKLFCKFKDISLFNCGRSNRHYKYVDAEAIDRMLTEHRFDKTLLITTSTLDCGVNLIDPQIKTIVVDMIDRDSLIQCVGRKRVIDENDSINLFIKGRDGMSLGGLLSTTKKAIKKAEYLLEHGETDFLKEYPRYIDGSGIIYTENDNDNNIHLKVNPLMLTYRRRNIIWYTQIKDTATYPNKDGYMQYFTKYFQQDIYAVYAVNHSLEHYLEDCVENNLIMYTTRERTPLINKINLRQGKRGKLLKGFDVLNACLVERELPYAIESFRTERIINGKRIQHRSAWRIIRRPTERRKSNK